MCSKMKLSFFIKEIQVCKLKQNSYKRNQNLYFEFKQKIFKFMFYKQFINFYTLCPMKMLIN